MQAAFDTLDDRIIPYHYGNPVTEVNALMNSVGLTDRSYLGKVRLRGKDALDLLNRISTNDMSKLMLGQVCDTLFTTPKGRIIDYCRAFILNGDIILISSYSNTNHLINWINRFVITEDAEAMDISDDLVWLMLAGPDSCRFIESLSAEKEITAEDNLWLNFGNIAFPVFSNKDYLVPAYDICISPDEAREIVPELKERLLFSEGSMAGYSAYQTLRVESGMPAWGNELSENYNPHEARLINAVSFTKGCYTGQEVIARLDAYDKVQKYLMVINPDDTIDFKPPLDIYLDDEKIGTLTSLITNPKTNKPVGLGYVSKNYALENINLKADIVAGNKRINSTLRIPPKNLTSF